MVGALYLNSLLSFSCSVMSDSLQLHGLQHTRLPCLSFTVSQSVLKLMSIESLMSSNHLILCCPLLPPSIFPSIRVFSNESILHIRWQKYWSFSFISPSSEHSGLISFLLLLPLFFPNIRFFSRVGFFFFFG